MLPRFLSLAVLILAIQPALDACTTFYVRAGDGVIFGRNYDFEIGDGQLMVNAAGLRKTGFLVGGPVWDAQDGSVTFNEFDPDFRVMVMRTNWRCAHY